ncbi:hypothetical protein TanjilG_15370 [Lupinus angustifolius]|uniref:WHY domain class transcription factor n=1 Tax=Lupinus angustifolius TaxID=3871 RepID=A0A1J7HA16_LUPAN|nr:hypothetical protein TanjilG_15370 [Lupinus angustifolius]
MLLKLSLPMPSPLLSFSQNFIPFSHPFKPLLTFNNSVKCRHSQPTSQAATPTPHSGAFKVSKEGHVLLQFAPAVGLRQYDWERKQIFSLSVGEMGTIISLGARDSCEFFHDPSKGKSSNLVVVVFEGVQNKLVNVDENIYIPVTKAEIAVLSSIFNFIIPYLIGWNTFTNSIKPDESIGVNSNSNPRYGGDYEWNR